MLTHIEKELVPIFSPFPEIQKKLLGFTMIMGDLVIHMKIG